MEYIEVEALNLPISEIVKTYSPDLQEEIIAYLRQLDEPNRKCYVIAWEHLGSSFNVARSNGFKEWQAKTKK